MPSPPLPDDLLTLEQYLLRESLLCDSLLSSPDSSSYADLGVSPLSLQSLNSHVPSNASMFSPSILLWIVGTIIVMALLLVIMAVRKQSTAQIELIQQSLSRLEHSTRNATSPVQSWNNARTLLRQRDRLLQQYDFARTLPDPEYQTWLRLTWKDFAYCTLDLIRLVRPLNYQDYRRRIKVCSATYDPQFRRFAPVVISPVSLEVIFPGNDTYVPGLPSLSDTVPVSTPESKTPRLRLSRPHRDLVEAVAAIIKRRS